MKAFFFIVWLSVLIVATTPANAFNLGKEAGNCFHGGCDIVWGINQRVDAGVRSKAESLFGPARDAFIEAMDHLFDKKLNPLVDRLNDDLSAKIGQVGDRADKIVQETTDGILKIVDSAGDLADKVTNDVNKIILVTFHEADQLIDKVNTDIKALLDDVDCKVNGSINGVVDYFRQLATFAHPWDACYTDLGYFATVPDATDTINWYRITKCTWTRDLDNSKTVEDIKYNYARLSVLARRMRCIAQDAPATQLANTDANNYARNFEMWLLASR